MKLCYLILSVLVLQSCNAQKPLSLPLNKDDNSLLWEVSGGNAKKPSYLFGTFHLLCKDDIHLSGNLKKALAASDEVYFEMDLDDPATVLGGMFFMNMKNGKTLKDLYDEKDYMRVSRFFSDSLKMNIALFNKMKPMMLEALLYPRMMPCKSPSGVEMEVMAIAKNLKKEIKGFETIEFQSSIFDSIPYAVQASALLKDIDSAANYRIYFNRMVNIYTSQRTDSLLKLISDTSFAGAGENEDVLLKNRNADWVKQINTIVPKKSIFMGVGAAHLLGENGLIAMLRKRGYKVRPIENFK